jgi:cell division protein ZapA
MSDTQSVTITVNRLSFPLKAPRNEVPKLEKAAKIVDEKIKTIAQEGKITGAEKIAVIAAVHIAYELLQTQDEKNINVHEIQQTIERLRSKIQNSIQAPETQAAE